MNSYAKLPKKQLYLILIPCAIIVLSSSIETMIKVKDISLYQSWVQTLNQGNSLRTTYDQSFDSYLVANLTYLFFKVVIPIFLSINTYLAYTHIRINRLFISIWTVLVLGGLSYTFVEQSFYSVFYYINMAGYIVLVIAILSLIKVINESKFS